MENKHLEDITETFGELYFPTSAVIFYQTAQNYNADCYTEFLTFDKNGTPLACQPLSLENAQELAQLLSLKNEKKNTFLQPKGLLPANVLHFDLRENGQVIWHTKAQQRTLFFEKSTGLENIKIGIPPLVWKADKKRLFLYALAQNRKPNLNTPLHYAPFFNIYENGNVCMGSVKINLPQNIHLEEFIHRWETYFFESYFSHPLGNYPLINGKTDIKSLWKELSKTQKPFPTELLQPNRKQLKEIF